MYKEFYKLRRNPFEITPDPAFLYPTRRHNEALAALYYGVRAHKGFVVMTGEVGTGKTMIVRYLLQLLKNSNVGYAYVYNPRLTGLEFLQYIAGDLGLSPVATNKSQLLLDLGRHLISRHQKQLITVLVVDEAHHLSADVLEEIRLLTNIETINKKLLQILLVGQPELDEKLDSSELRQLKQRIAFRCSLAALELEETVGYIEKRMQVSGADSNAAIIFPPDSVIAIHRHSRGIPRLINTICENALIVGYARELPSITPAIINEVAADLRLGIMAVSDARKATPEVSEELVHAVITLLKVHDQVYSEPRTEMRREFFSPRIVKHEPYI